MENGGITIGRDGSYLSFWIAPDSVLAGRWDGGTFPVHDFVLACCNRLDASHGYAGFALALPSLLDESSRWEPYELELAQRFYGLEIDQPIATALMTEGWKGIKGVNWYTILSGHYVSELGGSKAIKSLLTDPAFRFYDFSGGGLVIRAGGEPEMAPVKSGPPSLYVAVNSVVRSIRTKDIRPMGLGSNAGELRFNLKLTDLWMRRFDTPGIWPPAHF